MRRIARPSSRRSRARSSRTCACSVTSRAAVGSSAINNSGPAASAIASIARCRWPPESWCGNSRNRRTGSGIASSSRSSRARARAAPAPTRAPLLRCARTASQIWVSRDRTGLSAAIGSWKTKPIRPPRTARISLLGEAAEIASVEEDLPGDDLAGGRHETEDGQRREALARTRLADQADELAPRDREVDAAHDLERPRFGGGSAARSSAISSDRPAGKADLQPGNLEQRRAGRRHRSAVQRCFRCRRGALAAGAAPEAVPARARSQFTVSATA